MSKTAIVLGATGLVGHHLLEEILQDESYEKVTLFSRSPIKKTHPKIEEHLIDLFNLEDYCNQFKANDVFCCIGTTKSKSPDKKMYKKVDYGIPIDAAKLSGLNNIEKLLVVSAMGANRKSKVFYNRVKGQMERDVQFYNSNETYIFKPSLIGGKRNESRVGETIAKAFFSVLNPILPKKIRSIHPQDIAKAMMHVAKKGYNSSKIPSDEIRMLAK
ncbi:NAD(P)H-binding protein [Croceibacter atlanticus]|jgi:uncharacterized protein YbjT (DUF2867 family)|uniref:NAD(P)H-binding protein n=1 Tax=Croceibacter atlanticus TaxID=313588 RepID=UPI0030DCFF0D|tara:strand:+ start:4125 stop:4772 length:648 start_codon:yes stop_codon:yes gene_type:complete